MSLDSSQVRVAVTGAVKYAAVGVTVPADADTPLTTGWTDVGYLTEDGVVETRPRSTTNLVAWQNADVVRTVVTESSITVGFTMAQTSKATLELYYGATFDPVTGSIEIVPGETGGRRALVVDFADGADLVRLFLPQCEALEVGEQTLASGEVVGYEVTMTGYPDSTLGYSAKKWYSALAA